MKRVYSFIVMACFFCSINAEDLTPKDFVVPEETLTKMTVFNLKPKPKLFKDFKKEYQDSARFHYYVWLPKGYHKSAKKKCQYPFIIVDSPGGNAQNAFHFYKEWATQNKWICVLLVEARNNDKDGLSYANYVSTLNDMQQRFYIAPQSGIFTGFSGGARRASTYARAFPKMAGAVCHAGAGASNLHKEKQLFTATICGDHCFNVNEIYDVYASMGKRGYYDIQQSGHNWYHKGKLIRALDWLVNKMAQRKKSPLPKRVVSHFLKAQYSQYKSEEKVLVKYQILKRLESLMKARRDALKTSSLLRKVFKKMSKRLHKLKSDKSFNLERRAYELFEKTYQDYCVIGYAEAVNAAKSWSFKRSESGLIIKGTAENIKNSLVKMEGIVKKFKGTYAAGLASKEIERLSKLPENLTKGGY